MRVRRMWHWFAGHDHPDLVEYSKGFRLTKCSCGVSLVRS